MSRLKSNPAANRGRAAAASRAPVGGGRIFVQAPRSDIYVAMLGIALGAIILGSLLLVLRLRDYEFSTKPTGMILPISAATIAPANDLF